MKGYKGKIGFYKSIEHNFYTCHMIGDFNPNEIFNENYIFLGATAVVDVPFADTRQQEIETIKKQIEQANSEHQMNINRMLGKIQELQALENGGE